MGTVHLKPGRVQPLWAGHPWVFAQAIRKIEGAPGAGDKVRVVDPEGRFLGIGYYSPKSAIPVRVLGRDPDERLDEAAIGERLDRAAAFRRDVLGLPSTETSGYRLVHGAGDDLAGLVVDVYGDAAVVQIGTVGLKLREEAIFGHVARVTGAKTVIEMGGDHSRGEGFVSETRVVRGAEVDELRFRERGFELEVPTSLTQKTGYYFDQRDNRARLEALCAGRRVLDAYAYVGGISLAAARGGATEVVALERSAPAVAAGATIARHNRLGDVISFRREDVKKAFPRLIAENQRFDVVVVDPPKLAPTRRHLDRARRAYRKLNQLAVKLVSTGGILVSCSCSSALSGEELVRLVTLSARDARAHARLLHLGGQSADHLTPAAFKEGRYLDAAFLRIDR